MGNSVSKDRDEWQIIFKKNKWNKVAWAGENWVSEYKHGWQIVF